MTGQVQRYLKTEELYDAIIDMICPDVIKEIGETPIRSKLDAILTQGKIEGRVTAYTDAGMARDGSPQGDRLIEDWQRIVDSA
jgi:hypothetical protein